MNEDKLQKFYKNAQDLNPKFTMDYETFKTNMQDNEKRSKFYGNVRKLNPAFTMSDQEADVVLGFVNKEPEKEKPQKSGFLQRTFGNTQQAQMYASQVEEDKKKEEEAARQEQSYQNVGLTDEDKKTQERIATLESQVSSPVSINADGTFHVQQPELNQYGMPTTMTKISNEAAKSQLETAKAQLPSYLKRGEDSPEDIMTNAVERALNTEEGKNTWNTLFDATVKDFHTTPEFAELLNKYSLGEVTEQDINNAFNEKYGEQLNRDFIKEISKEGGIMHDYITVADKKFNQKHTDQTSKELDERIESAIEKSKETRKNSNREKYKSIYGVYPEDDPFGKERTKQLRYEGVLEYETELSSEQELLSARKFNKETRTLIDAVKNGKSFWGGVGDAASDLDTWDLGIGELTRNIELMGVIKKIEGDKELTSAEELLMESALNYFTASAYYSNELGRGYKAGQTSMASVPFMLQFVLSSGTIAAMEASVKGTVETGRRALVSGMIKYAKKKGNAALAKYGAKKAAGDAGKMVSGVMSGAASSVIGAGYMTGVYSLPRVAGGTIERMTGELDKDWDSDKGGYVFTERKNAQGLGEALWNSFADNYVENLSEMVLAKTLDPVKAYLGGTNMFKNIARNDYIGAIVDLRNNPALRSLRQTTQFGGYFEEVAEEYLGGILRRMLNTDVNTWQEAGLDFDGQIDIFLGLAPTSILFGTYGVASHYGGIAINAKELREYLSTDEQKEMFDRLMSESRSGEFGDVAHDFIRNVLTSTDPRMTVERKKEILMSVANKYHNLLSEELQNVTTQVTEQEAKPIVDELTKDVMHEGNNAIYATVDSQGNPLFIVGGNVKFTNDNVVDLSSSDSRLQVRYVKADHTLGDVQEVRTANLTNPVTNENVENFSKFQMAKFIAQSKSLDNFEFDGHVYSIEGEDLGTVEEFNTLQGNTEQIGEPKIDTKPRTVVNDEYTVTVDGEKKTVKITSMINSPMIQNEDGSIKEGKFSVTVNGEAVRGDERKQKYIDAISEQLKEKHAKALEAYRAKQAESTVTETPSSVLTDEDRAAAAAEQERMAKEAEKQSVLASAQQKKAKKYTPEEAVVVLMEQGNDVATRLVGSRINKLRTQIDEINADENKDELEKWEDSKELSDQLAEYEAAVVKWLGQETLDAINATRVAPAAPVVEAAPVEEGPAVPQEQAPAVEPAQGETPAEPVAPEQETPQDDVPAEPDTTPLPHAEPVVGDGEVNEEEKEPMNLLDGQYAIVSSNSTRGKEQIVKVTQNEDGTETWTNISDDSVVSQRAYKKQQFPEQDNMRVLGIKQGNEITPVIVLSGLADLSQAKGELKVVPVNTKDGKVHEAHVSLLYKQDADGGWSLLKGVGSRVLSPAESAKYNSLDALLDFPIIPNVTVGNFTLRDMLEYPTLGKLKQRLEQLGIEYDKQTINTNLETALARWRELVRENNLNDEFQSNIGKLNLYYYNIYRAGVEPFKAGVPVEDTKRTRSNKNLYIQLDTIGMLPNSITNPVVQLAVLTDIASQLGIVRPKENGRYIDSIEPIIAKTEKEIKANEEEFTGKPKGTVEKAAEDKQPDQQKPKAQKPKAEAKEETPAPAKPKTNIDSLRDAFVEAYARTQNQAYNALQKTMAKNAFKGMIDKMSEEDSIALYLNLAMESAKSQGKMQEDMVNAAKALLDSKHGAAINAITGGAQQETNQAPVETTEEATEETEQTAEDAIDYEALVAERNELQETIYDMEDDEAANANARINEINEILRNRAEFMEGNVTESSASQEAKELALAAEIQALTDSEDIEVVNVTAEQAEEARRTGKGEMQVSNETQRIFVSNAERAVESIKQEKATPQQWKAMIEKQGGLKAGEDKWLGLSEWLDNQDKKTLTKQDILDFIAENQIQIEELGYTEDGFFGTPELEALDEEYKKELSTLLDDGVTVEIAPYGAFDKMVEKYGRDFKEGFYGTSFGLGVNNTYYIGKLLNKPQINPTRKRYTTNGLTNKQEIAITVPSVRPYNEGDHIHFGDAGNGRAVAWVRFGETEDADGNRVLVIDEIQSKRHQDGREKGYSNTELHKKIEEAEQKLADIYAKSSNNVQRINELISEIKGLRKDNEEKEDAERYELARLREEQNNVRNNRDYDRLQAEIDEISEIQLKRLTHISKLNTELRLLQERELDNDEVFDLKMEIRNYELELLDKVPDAPFDKNWHELAFKRMLRYAAENGFDYVAWTTGAQQAERYDIGEVINKIITTSHTFRGNPRKSVSILMTNGNRVSMSIDNTGIVTGSDGGIYNGKNLSEIVGKELADRIINNEGKDATLYSDYTNEEIPAKELSGDNLRIGGEGMKGFYDKMLPSFVSKYTKKWGAKVQDINLPELEESAQTMHAVNVTPEMKESVMQGQPMFSIESTPLMTSKGVIYGYALGNKIYLTPDGMNTNTPVHEYTHIWAKAMQKHNPKAWKSIVEQLKKAEALWNEVVNDPNYENIKNDEDAIASEVLSRYSGKSGAAKLEAEAERVASEYKGMEKGLKVKALISRVKKALEKFWSWVGKNLFEIESFESVESIADRVLYDMLNNTQLNLDNSKKSSTFAENNENYERTDEFRELQERSLGLSQSRISEFHSGERKLSDEDRKRVGGVFQRLMESERNGGRNGQWVNLTGKGNQFKIAQVNPAIFHDIFQICRNYLPNGELVDLHDNYADCKCFISEDGLCGFAIEPNGNLISVFSLNPSDKKGFLYAIKDLIRQEGATHLDCFVSNRQPLTEIYQKALGFHVASEMDYNMEYDHDNIAENHGMPKIAFMVDKPTEKREFDGESYDAAYDYQQSQTSTAEREQIVAEAKANGTYMTAPNGQSTNLTEDMWVSVRTQAFKDWFGDWQNDPANASKVLDENGEPLVVYHGSKMAGFDEFQQLDESVNGFFTTDNKAGANTYATNREERRNNVMADEAQPNAEPHHGIYSLFANIKNPAEYDFAGKMYNEYGEPQGYYVEMSGEEWDMLPVPKFATEEEALAFARENGEPDSAVKTTYLSTDDLVEMAKAAGHDGVIFKNVLDGAEHNEEQPVMNDYIAFEPNQLKSATQNIGTFSSEDNRIEFMIGPAAPAGAPRDPSDPMHIDSEAARRLQAKSQKYFAELANPKAQLPNELDAMNEWVAKLLDRTEGVRQIMESINKFRKENGLPPMGEGFDVRTMVEAMDSKIANETKLFVMTKENELRKAIYKLAKRVEKSDFYKKYKFERELKQNGKKSKLTPREIIERYLIACDSIEREELKGNPRGAGDFLKRMGVDMVQYRQEFLDTFANTQEGIDEINHLWDTIRGVTDMVISEGERSGLISQEEAISYKRRRFYVPERDFAEVEANEELQVKDAGYGSGRMGNKLMATQEAEGGESLAANILANMTLLARDAIVKANKNIVKLAMFDLLRANEEWCKAKHVPIPRQVWYKRNADGSVTRVTDGPTAPEKKIMRDIKTQIRDRENEIIQERMLAESATDAATRQAHMDIISEIEDEIESLRLANPFLDEFDARDMMFLSRHTQKESTVTVFVDGVPCEMHFPNMTIVANALNGTTNKKFAAEGLKKLTNALSATMTVYNPAFFTVNVVRDIPFILAKGYAEYGWQFPVRFAAQLTKKLFTLDVWKAVAGNYKDVKNPYIREFFEGGGNTGYSTIPDIDKLKSATRRWDRRRTDIGMQDIGDVISYMNTFSEVWTRLAAYSVVRDMGGTKEAGVRAAKNLSVNFNRKGLGAPIWDTFMNMSFFANAALQGASGFYRTFKGSKDTVAKNVAVGFRAANAFLATPMFAGFISTLLHPDDDDELLWINDWDRDNYWYVGENGFRIAINEQIKPAWVIGVNIALGMKGRRTKEQIASSIISSVFTNWLPTPQNVNGALTMITNSYYGTKDYSTAQIIENLTVPQAMASFTDIANNVDFMGYKIKNESGDLPAYMSNENSALLYKMVAEFLYEAKGGDKDLHSRHIEVVNEDGTIDYKKMSDLYDKSPKEINTILSIAIGSTWKDFGNAIAVASTDGEFVPTDYQTIKRFYKPTDKEMTILSIMREARGITKDYTEQYNNYINQLAGSQLDGNTEKGRKARERIENLIGKGEDRGQKEMLKALVNAYDANTMYSHAKQFGMNETQFKKSLKENRPDLYDAFDAYNNTSREELVRKVLTLTRDIKDMEVKTIEAEEWLNEITE